MRGQLRSESETKLAFWPLGLMPDHGLSCCKYDTNPRRKPCSDQCNYLFRIRPVEGVIGIIRRLRDENDIAVGFVLIEVGVF